MGRFTATVFRSRKRYWRLSPWNQLLQLKLMIGYTLIGHGIDHRNEINNLVKKQ